MNHEAPRLDSEKFKMSELIQMKTSRSISASGNLLAIKWCFHLEDEFHNSKNKCIGRR